MRTGSEERRLVRFDAFEADLRAGELKRDGARLKLGEQPFLVLAALLAQPGELVTREELRARLWPADTFVDFDRGLNKAINRLREALGDSAAAPRFIETLPKRGYRFIGAVESGTQRTPAAIEAPAEPADAPEATAPGASSRSERSRPGPGVAAVLLLGAIAAIWWTFTPAPDTTSAVPLIRSSLLPPPDRAFVHHSIALSHDGTHLAFVAEAPDGTRSLWIRAMASTSATPIPGTEGATFPFWAPDRQQIGFFAHRTLNVVDLAGGSVRAIADAPRASGGTWSPDDVIVFAPDVNGPLYRLPASGGTPVPASRMRAGDGLHGHRWPVFLPDGRHFLYVAVGADTPNDNAPELRCGSLDTPDSSPVEWEGGRSAALALGHLVYARGGTLYAQPFDAVTRQTSGPAMPVGGGELAVAPAFFPSALAVSPNGVLVFLAAGDRPSRLAWLDQHGREQERTASMLAGPALSPDGTKVAGSCAGPRSDATSICVVDLARGVPSRISPGPNDRFPVWSPDGRAIAYASDDGIVRIPADGSSPPQAVSRHGTPTGWLADGRVLTFGGHREAVTIALASPDTHDVTSLGPGAEGQLSPDGAWLAYVAPDGLVAERFPGGAPRITLAPAGANQPRWSRSGGQVFYVRSDKKLMVVDVDATGTASAPRVVAQTRIVGAALVGHQYDVAPDGRFVVNMLSEAAAPLTLMSGWEAALPRRSR